MRSFKVGKIPALCEWSFERQSHASTYRSVCSKSEMGMPTGRSSDLGVIVPRATSSW